jgi:hypothetical protein
MRSVSIFIFAIAYVLLCQSCNPTGLPIKKEALTGNWIVLRTTTSEDYIYEQLAGQKVKDMRRKAEMSIFQFQPNGNGTTDLGQSGYKTFSWTFNPNQQLSMQIKEPGQPDNSASVRPRMFTVTYYKHDSLIIQNVVKNNWDSAIVKTVFLQLKSNDTIPDLFQPALNKWREKPLQAESDEAIRARLKQVLYYYSAYFASFAFNKINHFNTTKILCPIRFFSNGISLKQYKEEDEWTKVFYDNQDAQKAHDLLGEAISSVKHYPDKGDDTVQEFVIALKMVGDKL